MENEINIFLGGLYFYSLSLRKNLSTLKWKKELFRFYTPLYKKSIKQKQNKPMETTIGPNLTYSRPNYIILVEVKLFDLKFLPLKAQLDSA